MVSEKEIEAAREAWREYWSDVIGQYEDNKGPMEGMRRALSAAARVRAEANNECGEAVIPAPQPSGAVGALDEGLEILNGLIDNIKRRGNYSPEATCTFIDQAGQCLREALSALTAGKPEQAETVDSVLLDALRKIASTDLSGCANMTTAEIFGALSRMHETARRALEEQGGK